MELINLINHPIYKRFEIYFNLIKNNMSRNFNKFLSDNGIILLGDKYTKFIVTEIYSDLIRILIYLIRNKYNNKIEFESNIFWIFDNLDNAIEPTNPQLCVCDYIGPSNKFDNLYKLDANKIIKLDLKIFLSFAKFIFNDSYIRWIELDWNGF